MTAREHSVKLLLRLDLVTATREQPAILKVGEVHKIMIELDLRAVCEDRLQRNPSTRRCISCAKPVLLL